MVEVFQALRLAPQTTHTVLGVIDDDECPRFGESVDRRADVSQSHFNIYF